MISTTRALFWGFCDFKLIDKENETMPLEKDEGPGYKM